MVRFSWRTTGTSGATPYFDLCKGTTADAIARIKFEQNGNVTLQSRYRLYLVDRGTTTGLNANTWNTVWLYYRGSKTTTGTGNSASGSTDGRWPSIP